MLHCFTGGRDLARRAIALGLYISFTGILTFKNSTALRAIAAELPADRILVETDAPYLAPEPVSRQAQRAGLCRRDRKVLAETRGVSFDEIARQTTENFFRLFSKVPQPAGRRISAVLSIEHVRGMTLKFTILGCGSSGGVPRPALGWGACDPNNPKNRRRRTSLLVERHGNGGVTRVLIDTSPDLREQLLATDVDWLDGVFYSHEHADHTHGIDDLRSLFIKQRRRVDVYMDEQPPRSCAHGSAIASSRRPAANIRRSSTEHPTEGRPSDHRRRAGRNDHGATAPAGARRYSLARLPFRQVRLFLRPQRHAAERPRRPWRASTSGSSMRFATGRIRAISRLPMHWSGSSGSSRRRAILTNLHADLDYDVLRRNCRRTWSRLRWDDAFRARLAAGAWPRGSRCADFFPSSHPRECSIICLMRIEP